MPFRIVVEMASKVVVQSCLKVHILCEILGVQSGLAEHSCLVGCYAGSLWE